MTEQQIDTIEKLAGAEIQHGTYNDRIYLMKIGDADPAEVANAVMKKAQEAGYSKVFAKIPESLSEPFMAKGFREEARVPKFFNGEDTALFLGAYLDPKRKREEEKTRLDEVLDLALSRQTSAGGLEPPLLAPFELRPCTESDVDRMAEIYSEVFPTYPFPIQDPGYLLETMRSHVDYFGIVDDRELVALSSAEMDTTAENVEMTDFATLPRLRGNSFGTALLSRMEKAMRQRGIPTAYTIARAASPGMNITFAKLGYDYGGRLVNNTNISGRIESMNIWYKPL